MRGRMPWMLLLGAGAGLLMMPAARRRLGAWAAQRASGPGGEGRRLPPEPEVVHGTVPAEGSERSVASAAPDVVPERSTRAVAPARHPDAPDTGRFEPVIPDAPELWDPAAEPASVEADTVRAQPVPPTVRKRS